MTTVPRLAAAALATGVLLAGCATARATTADATHKPARPAARDSPTALRPHRHHPAVTPGLLPTQSAYATSTVGSTVVAVARLVPPASPGQGAVTVVTFDPTRTTLVLHAGSAEPLAGRSWRYGATVGPTERATLVAAFNGGFKMRDARGGWMSQGRTVVPLVKGAASVVVYADGGTDIGAWGRDVPQPGRRVVSVRQNLRLLVNAGRPQHTHPPDQRTLDAWWGHAFLDQRLIARSALGVTASGALVWAAGTDITVAALADALVGAGVVRALELDINAPLVRGFLYPGAAVVRRGAVAWSTMLPLVVGQRQLRHDPGVTDPSIAPHCTYVVPCSRDFFTVLTR